MKKTRATDMIRLNMSEMTIWVIIKSKGATMKDQTLTETGNIIIIINIETKEIITSTMKTEEGIKDSLHTQTEAIEEIKDTIHMTI